MAFAAEEQRGGQERRTRSAANPLYRRKAADLSNEKLSAQELSKTVERYSDKPNNCGLSSDNIYLTAVEPRSIGIIAETFLLNKFDQRAARRRLRM